MYSHHARPEPPHACKRTCPLTARFKTKASKAGKLETLTLLGMAGAEGLNGAIKHGKAIAAGALLTR